MAIRESVRVGVLSVDSGLLSTEIPALYPTGAIFGGGDPLWKNLIVGVDPVLERLTLWDSTSLFGPLGVMAEYPIVPNQYVAVARSGIVKVQKHFGSAFIPGDLVGGAGGPQSGRGAGQAFFVSGWVIGFAADTIPTGTTGLMSVDVQFFQVP